MEKINLFLYKKACHSSENAHINQHCLCGKWSKAIFIESNCVWAVLVSLVNCLEQE